MSIKSQFRITAGRATFILSLTAIALSGTAHANQCGDISQALTAMGDSYYDVGNRGDDPEQWKFEQLQLLEQSNVFIQLRDARFRSGTGERTRCYGSEKNGRMETRILELGDINQKDTRHPVNAELAIDVYEYDRSQRTLRRESVYFPSNLNTNIVATADGEVLRFNTRRRQATETGSIFRETIVDAVSTDTGVDIKQSIYVNGHLAEWFSWSLTSKK